MQTVYKNGTEGEIHVENTIEDLLPHIKKSLENPHVKYVKVFRGKTLKDEKRFTAEEKKKNILDAIAEQE